MPRLTSLARCAILLVMLAAWPACANALSCSFSISDVSFGNIDLSGGQYFDSTGVLTATCTGNPNQNVRICPNIAEGTGGAGANGDPRYMLQAANTLAFQLYSDAARTTIWGSWVWAYSPRPPDITLQLDGSGNGSTNHIIYARVLANQPGLPGGVYSSSFSGANTRMSYADAAFNSCFLISLFRNDQAPFNVTANNVASCTVSATDMNFGSHGVLATTIYANTSISVTCPSGVAYAIGLDGGLSGAADPTQRHMTQAGNFVTYGIYRDAGYTQPWGSTIGTNTQSGTGTGSPQTYAGRGRVLPQSTPAPNTYNDTIVVTVTY